MKEYIDTKDVNIMKRNISLIGFMGTGKSAIGRSISRDLGYRFIDTDRYIEEAMGRTITEIFIQIGEKSFRELEKEFLKKIVTGENQVIATGGGIVLSKENRDLLKSTTFVVCLKATPKTIYYRTKRKNTRPLLRTQKPLKKINQLLKQRKGLYDFGDITLYTDNFKINELTKTIIHQYHLYLLKENTRNQSNGKE